MVVRLDLSGVPEVLTILSGRESTVRRLDLLREAVGDDPADWYPALTGARLARRRSRDGDAASPPGRRPNERSASRSIDGVGSGVAAALRAVDCCASETAQSAFGRLFGTDGALLPALTILLTLYVAFFAFSLITGRSRLGIRR